MAASIIHGCGYLFLLWKGAQNDAHCNCIKPPSNSFSKLSINRSNPWLVWLGDPYNYIAHSFFVDKYFQIKSFFYKTGIEQTFHRERIPDVCTYSASLNVISVVISNKFVTGNLIIRLSLSDKIEDNIIG